MIPRPGIQVKPNLPEIGIVHLINYDIMEYLTVKQDQLLWNRQLANMGWKELIEVGSTAKAESERKCDFVIL